jgi:aspartate/methionine/tyrosine aminotransferase
LLAALTPGTRMVMINSPNNPTGWTLTRAEQQAILDRCRGHGIWLVADDVYERLYYREDTPAAPSFLDLAAPDGFAAPATSSFVRSRSCRGSRSRHPPARGTRSAKSMD